MVSAREILHDIAHETRRSPAPRPQGRCCGIETEGRTSGRPPHPCPADPGDSVMGAMTLDIPIIVTQGVKGCELWVDGMIVHDSLTPWQAIEAKRHVRSLVFDAPRIANAMLAAALANARGSEAS